MFQLNVLIEKTPQQFTKALKVENQKTNKQQQLKQQQKTTKF